MPERKKRILLCNESAFLSTGFAVYGREVMSRLHATGKYELAELGAYGPPGDPRQGTIPWRYYQNMPGSEAEEHQYRSRPTNQFGEWRFEQTCLDFRPDIVFDVRDWWMLEFQQRSPFRPYFWWSLMPTVDAEPQDEQWMATYMDANAVFAYSDWGLDLLRRQSGGLIKTVGAAPPGANLQFFRPVANKTAIKKACVLDDCLVVGTVMRNQKRKLFPDLVSAFAKFLGQAPEEIRHKTYLYLHTSWPDVGWDIPRLIKEHGIGHRTLISYLCQNCKAVYPSLFADARSVCKNCGLPSATIPNSIQPVPDQALAGVYNLMDVYVQYAICEGFGMPQVEAAACGVPVMAVDYSAMSDVVRKLKGVPIKVKRMYRESETHCYRALPDDDHFVSELIDLLSLPATIRTKMGADARGAVEQHYTYERTAKVWESHFDQVPVIDHTATWQSPVRLHRPNVAIPPGLSAEQFVRWGMLNIAGRPDLLNSYTMLRMVRDLNYEATLDMGMGGPYFNEASMLGQPIRWRPFGREQCVEALLGICQQRNIWEEARARAVKTGVSH